MDSRYQKIINVNTGAWAVFDNLTGKALTEDELKELQTAYDHHQDAVNFLINS